LIILNIGNIMDRRALLKSLGTMAVTAMLPLKLAAKNKQTIIKPPRLQKGDTIGLITPASSLFETEQTKIEAKEKMEALGFKVKFGNNINKKWGYLAGSDEERATDILDFFEDDDVKAIFAIRGGYGSGRLLRYLDYEIIEKNPKILLGYSDITSLLIAVHQKTGLVTFHGPVAISTFTEYTQKYFYKTLTDTNSVGEIEDAPYDENLQQTNRVWTVNGGKGRGKLIGGNLTLICMSLGTPYEIDTNDRILFIEEVGEEPYDMDRMLTHLYNAGKLENCNGIVFDRMARVKTANYSPAYSSSLSVEEIIKDRFKEFDYPVCLGLSLGHIKDKPTLPLGIEAEIDANQGRLTLLESAVI
jgi:muramoyltetrapeptide carboxypeptidase